MPSASLLEDLTRALQPGRPAAKGTASAGTVVVLGVGSDLRADDAAGIRVAERLARLSLSGVRAVIGGTAPENATAEIRRLAPSHLLIVDAAEMGEDPGSVRLIDPEEVGGASFSTHSLPMSVLAGYLRGELGCRVTLLGIEPKSLAFGGAVSPEVEAAIGETVAALEEALRV
ncbi:MAG: hydrogenase maturation peptidase HycI [Candidatus Bipolaricaulota bacterium]|nr:hydrogenase maturation peptidase HycI [Candidatus Bipolaricaulota bacterium]